MDKMDSSKDMRTETSCRTCAKNCVRRYAINSKICNFSTTIKDMIVLLVPQMETELDDNDCICNFCRQTLIRCVRFIHKCLRVEADRKENVLYQKKSPSDIASLTSLKAVHKLIGSQKRICSRDGVIKKEVDNLIDDQKDIDNLIDVHQIDTDNLIDVDQIDTDNLIDVQKGTDNLIDIDQKETVNFIDVQTDIDKLIDVDQKDTNSNSCILNGDFNNHEETNQVVDIRTESINVIDDNIFQNDLVEELPSSMIDHDTLISATQMCTDKLNQFIRILASNDVRAIQYSQDSGSTAKHKRVILIGSTFKCSKCYAYFAHRGKYAKHLKVHESFEKRQEERDRLRQRRIQKLEEKEARKLGTQMNGPERKQRKKKLQCLTCSEKLSSIEELEFHSKIHPRFVCEKCGKGFTTKNQISAHKEVHNERNSYICEVCGKTVKTRTQLKQHSFVHENVVHSCEKCPKVFNTVIRLRAHLRNAHGEGRGGIWPCKECGKIFKRSCLYRTHYGQIHLGNGPRKCDICGQGFHRSDYLTRHKRRHIIYGETRESLNNDAAKSQTNGPHVCNICMKVYKTADTLKRHILNHGTSKYCCKYCSRTFKIMHILARHEKKHEKLNSSEKYSCGYCWKHFETQEDLEIHHFSHNKLRYKCELCEESFSLKCLLNGHMANVHVDNDEAEEANEITHDDRTWNNTRYISNVVDFS